MDLEPAKKGSWGDLDNAAPKDIGCKAYKYIVRFSHRSTIAETVIVVNSAALYQVLFILNS